MKILVACEESGTVREAFKAKGHDAWSCDLLPPRIPGQHLQGDVRLYLNAGWDRLICFPDCTYLCGSGMHWTTRGLRDPQLTVDAIAFAELLWDSGIPQIALENPTGVLSTRSKLGKPSQIIQPYQFGDDASKGTCLWLRGLPKLVGTKFVEPRMVCKCGCVYAFTRPEKEGCPACGIERSLAKPRWANQTDSGQNKLGPSETRKRDRSTTYPGIANAMATQWI
jgi:hypothetical protein